MTPETVLVGIQRYTFVGPYIVPIDPRPTIAAIQQRVAKHYSIPLIEMRSSRRGRSVCRPRQVAMYLSKRLTPLTLAQIGHRFGDRDHSTVIHAVRTVDRLLREDEDFRAEVNGFERGFHSSNNLLSSQFEKPGDAIVDKPLADSGIVRF